MPKFNGLHNAHRMTADRTTFPDVDAAQIHILIRLDVAPELKPCNMIMIRLAPEIKPAASSSRGSAKTCIGMIAMRAEETDVGRSSIRVPLPVEQDAQAR